MKLSLRWAVMVELSVFLPHGGGEYGVRQRVILGLERVVLGFVYP